MTSDVEILETVSGQKIEFDQAPLQRKQAVQIKLTDLQGQHIDSEITELLKKGVIEVSNHEPGEFISRWITAAYISGKENVTADRESRISRRETEWSLNRSIFTAAIKKIGITTNN